MKLHLCLCQEFDGLQTPVTTGSFEQRVFAMHTQCTSLPSNVYNAKHLNLKHNKLSNTTTSEVGSSNPAVITRIVVYQNHEHKTTVVTNFGSKMKH